MTGCVPAVPAKGAAWLLLVVAILALAACPFSSDLPLSSPADATMDNALLGRWRAQDPDTGQWTTMTFVSFNDREYVAWMAEPDGKIEMFRAFVTVIDGERFLNARELDSPDNRSWSYVNYRLAGDTMSLRFVDDEIFSSHTFSSSDALRELVREHLHDPRLYSSDRGTSVMEWQRASN